jgi:hypothetical protein
MKPSLRGCERVGFTGHDLVRGYTIKSGTARARKARSGWFCLSYTGQDGTKHQRRLPPTCEYQVAGLLGALGGVK